MVRHKNRYIVVEINENNKPENHPLHIKADTILRQAILRQVQKLHGDFGIAAITFGFTTKYCNAYTRVAVVKVRRGPHRLVASCLPFIKSLNERVVSINTLYTGATIRNCFKFIKEYQEGIFNKYCLTVTGEARDALREAIMNLNKVEEIF